jgi:hypothetical protein
MVLGMSLAFTVGNGFSSCKGKSISRQERIQLLTTYSAVTFVIAVASAFVLPNDPLHTPWLNPEERELANARIMADTVGAKSMTSTWAGLKEAARDPKLWLFAFMQHMHLAANGQHIPDFVITTAVLICFLQASRTSSLQQWRPWASVRRLHSYSPARPI